MTIQTTSNPLSRVLYAKRKGKVFEEQIETWQRVYGHSQLCFDAQDVVRDLNRHFEDILDLDRNVRDWYANGNEYDDRLNDAIEDLMQDWTRAGGSLIRIVSRFERSGFQVEGADRLRANYREGSAIVGPEPETLSTAQSEIRDRAVADHRAGKTVDGLIDK